MKKEFDAVGWMRQRRTVIDGEDEGLTWEQRREKTRQLLEIDPLWRTLKARHTLKEQSRKSAWGRRHLSCCN